MNTMIRLQVSAVITRRLATILGLLFLALMLMTPGVVSAYAGLGDYISEKLLGDSAVPNASLYLGDSASGPVVLGSGPIITTLSVTETASAGGVVTATLRGNLTDLNGMPRADVWFVWGYTSGALTNTSTTNTVTSTGIQSIGITGIDLGLGTEVFYQFRSSTDGTTMGATSSFQAGGGHGASYWLLRNLLMVVIAATIIVTAIVTRNPIVLLLASLIGLIGFTIIEKLLQVL